MTKLTDSEYRLIDCESFSSIKYLLDSPLEYRRNKVTPFTGSAATLLGTAIHHYLQGNRHLVAINPYKSTASEGFGEFKESFMESVGEDGVILPKSAEEKLNAIMMNFNANSFACDLMSKVEHEVPMFFEFNGVKLKGKGDGHITGLVSEVKSTGSCEDAWQFKQNAVIAKHYDLQAFMYLTGYGYTEEQFVAGDVKHYFIAALTRPPYTVNAYKLSYESYKRGEKKLYKVTSDYKKYIIRGEDFIPEPEIEEV